MNKPLFKSQRPQIQSRDVRPKNGIHRIDELIAILIRKYDLLAERKRERSQNSGRSRTLPVLASIAGTSNNEPCVGKPDLAESLVGESDIEAAGPKLRDESTSVVSASRRITTAETKSEPNSVLQTCSSRSGYSPQPFPAGSMQATFDWYQSVESPS